jgi:flagellar basal-body rod protein FlgF
MLSGIFQAAAGMKVRLSVHEIIANNLANAGSAGFQREVASVWSAALPRTESAGPPQVMAAPRGFPPFGAGAGNALRGALAVQAPAEFLETQSTADARSGALHDTQSPNDLALDGPGYLVVKTAAGVRLIRGGALMVNARGQLATTSGDPLLAQDGSPLQVGTSRWKIGADGVVTADGKPLGRLRVVEPTGTPIREGAHLMAAGGIRDVKGGSTRVLQGFLEHSNVDPVREMVDMIAGVRAYEAAQRAVVAQDETLQNLMDVVRR